MKKNDKIILYSLFIFPVILLFGFGLWTFIFGRGVEEITKQNNFEESFSGKVDSLFVDKQDHGTKKAILSDKYIFSMPARWEHYVELGDSISKKKKSFRIFIYKNSNEKVILDYKETYKKQ